MTIITSDDGGGGETEVAAAAVEAAAEAVAAAAEAVAAEGEGGEPTVQEQIDAAVEHEQREAAMEARISEVSQHVYSHEHPELAELGMDEERVVALIEEVLEDALVEIEEEIEEEGEGGSVADITVEPDVTPQELANAERGGRPWWHRVL